MSPSVGVIGLGNIGGGVARNLARAGYQVHAADLDPNKVGAVTAAGGIAASSATEAASLADVVFTSLPGPKHIIDVGAQILSAMKPGSIWVELSTNDLETARELSADCDAAAIGLVDAPVSGGPEGAEAGTLSVFVGGNKPDVNKVMPLLDVIGSKVDHLGERGTGIVAKIAQVTLCYTQTVTLIEALILGVKGGIEPHKMLNLIQNSAGRSYVADNYGPEILAGTYDASFPISHAAKDMRLAMELAKSVEAKLPFMARVAELYSETEARYGPTAAHLLAAQLIEQENGVALHQHERPR
jgi:3-hydroxyisobutyrate dehydrogenase